MTIWLTQRRIIIILLLTGPLALILFGGAAVLLGSWVWDRYIILWKDITDLTTADGKVFEGTGVFVNRRDRGSILLSISSIPDGVSRDSLEHNAESYTLEIRRIDGNGKLGDPSIVETPGHMTFSVGYGCFPRSRQQVKAVVKFREPVPEGVVLSLVCEYPIDGP